ncbi:carbohydrate ABC transporter permease [Aquabacterium sp. A7-Y]|uniref:carbohydrate ABC transporter permease n=1 Tax=Aquabacterium sp. A7-Y TaxID=1349605 RepID=UPI00223DB86F|nr:carbohydrate ABC transporter permease [Aquabacterium sp. A7-Y]MCW7542033.1 carbohydrate ABC transporter permease [Aquabacterium sp. A7-Y]
MPKLRPSQRRTRRVGTLLHYLLLVAIALFCAFPMLWTLSTAIGTEGNVFAFPPSLVPQKPSWVNFAEVFKVIDLGRYYWNSIWITFWTVVWTVVVCALAAYPLARLKFKGRQLVFSAILVTLMLPTEVNFLVNFITMTQLGLVNTHLGVILPTIAGAIGIFMLKSAFEEVPQDLIDAARVDGASELRIFWQIMLPLALPQIATLVIFTTVTSWNNFLWPGVVLTRSELMPLAVGILELSGTFGSATRVIAAGAVLTIAPALLVFFFTQRFFMRGLDGAVK